VTAWKQRWLVWKEFLNIQHLEVPTFGPNDSLV
jgi:hypothetical protein